MQGWYGSPGCVSCANDTWKRLSDWSALTYPGKPFTVSETGGGGIFEWVNDTSPGEGQFWSQKYQANLVSTDAAFLVGNANVSGVALWLLHDFKVDDESCGQCQYLPHADNLTVPWDCGFVNVECGGGASCLNKPCGRPAGLNHSASSPFFYCFATARPAITPPCSPFPHLPAPFLTPPRAEGTVDFWRRKKESFPRLAAIYGA